MIAKTMRCTLFGVAVAALAPFPAAAESSNKAAASDDSATTRPMIVAQASRPAAGAPRLAVADAAAYPAYQRGVIAAAREGNEALRRYIWRTRMIYDFYYPDFANE